MQKLLNLRDAIVNHMSYNQIKTWEAKSPNLTIKQQLDLLATLVKTEKGKSWLTKAQARLASLPEHSTECRCLECMD
jgi:hypothetical protein